MTIAKYRFERCASMIFNSIAVEYLFSIDVFVSLILSPEWRVTNDYSCIQHLIMFGSVQQFNLCVAEAQRMEWEELQVPHQ